MDIGLTFLLTFVVCGTAILRAGADSTNITVNSSMMTTMLTNGTTVAALANATAINSTLVNTTVNTAEITTTVTTRTTTPPKPTTTTSTTTPSTTTQPIIGGSTLIPAAFISLYRDKVIFTVITVPLSENIRSEGWKSKMALRLANLIRQGFLQYVFSGRRKREIAKSGDFNVQLLHTARLNPSVPKRVTLTYAASQQDTLLSSLQVEKAIASLTNQEAALQMQYPVVVPAEASQGTQLYNSTDPPKLSKLELGLTISLSVIGGLIILGIIFWLVCCCLAVQKRNRAEFRRVDVEGSAPQLVSATPLAKEPALTPIVGGQLNSSKTGRPLPALTATTTPAAETTASKYKTESPDDGFSDDDSKTKRSNASSSSTPPVSRHSSRSYTSRSMRQHNRIAPSLVSDIYTDPIYSSIHKLPPLDSSRRYLVSGETDMAELEYYRNKQHNRSLRSSARSRSRTSANKSKRHRDTHDNSDTGMETDDIIEGMDSNRSRMHRLLDDMLAVASSPPSSRTTSKKKKKKRSSSSSSSSSGSSSSSSSSSKDSKDKKSDKDSKSSDKKDKKKKKKDKKDKEKKSKKEKSSKEKDEEKVTAHEPLSLGSTGDPYSQFAVSPYTASDQVAKLQQTGLSTQTSAWVMDSSKPMSSTLPAPTSGAEANLSSTNHDWSKRKTLHIPKPKLGTPELNQLANIKSAANDDNYTSLVLSTAMFRSRSPTWDDVPS